jgi:multimeric flavodoxin WrbA
MILVGTPTWAGMPSPYLKTFLNKAENVKGKKGALFLLVEAQLILVKKLLK